MFIIKYTKLKMVNKNIIKAEEYKKIGFNNKNQALEYIKSHNFRSKNDETEYQFLNRLYEVITQNLKNINKKYKTNHKIPKNKLTKNIITKENIPSFKGETEEEFLYRVNEKYEEEETEEEYLNKLDKIHKEEIIGEQEEYNVELYTKNMSNTIKKIFKQNQGKTLRVKYTVKNKKDKNEIIIDHAELIPKLTDKLFETFWNNYYVKVLLINSGVDIFKNYNYEGTVEIIELRKLVKNSIDILPDQNFLDGITHCVLTPIKNWAQDLLKNNKKNNTQKKYKAILKKIENNYEEQYKNGFNKDELKQLCEDLNIEIHIKFPIKHKKIDYNLLDICRPNKAIKKFYFINTRLNHLEIEDHLINIDNVINVNKDEIIKIKQSLEKQNKFFYSKYNYKNLYKLFTEEGIYQTNNEYYEITKKFEKSINFSEVLIDSIKDEKLYNFISTGLHHNGTRDFINNVTNNKKLENQIKHIDMEKAYVNFKNCEEYCGYPGKITDWRKTNKIMGLGYYKINNIKFNNKKFENIEKITNIYKNYNVYPNPELEFLKKMGCTFDISEGCWGVQKFEFQFDEKMINGIDEYNVRYYCKWAGCLDSNNIHESFWCKGEENYFKIMKEHYGDRININYDKKSGEAQLLLEKKNNLTAPHIYGYITAYQRIQTIQQLYEMDEKKLVRVCVDGIYFYEHEFKIQKGFRIKQDINLGNTQNENSYCNNIWEYTEITQNIFRENYAKELFIGQGGNGKTHLNMVDEGLIKKLYVSPSWKLAINKKKEYEKFQKQQIKKKYKKQMEEHKYNEDIDKKIKNNLNQELKNIQKVNVNVLANLLENNKLKTQQIKNKYNVLIIDEVSMMTNKQKDIIFSKYSNMKIIFCGDIGYQLSPILQINEKHDIEKFKSEFDNIQKLKINYRFKCDILKKLCKDLRKFIRQRASIENINQYVVELLYQYDQVIDKEKLKEIYNIEDYILVSKTACKEHKNIKCNCDEKNLVKEYTDMFKNKFQKKEKYYIIKKNKKNLRGDIIISEEIIQNAEIRHAFTSHSIQGQTIEEKNKIFIDMKYLFSNQMLYTMISRAKTIKQIFIIR